MSSSNKIRCAGRPKRIRGNDETRKRILYAARTIMARDGIDKTTIRNIANEANVSGGLINQYFGSKKELLHEVFSTNSRPLHEYLRGHLEQFDTPLELMMAVYKDYLTRYLKNPALTRQVMSDSWQWSPEHEEHFCTTLTAMTDIICSALCDKFYPAHPKTIRTATHVLISSFAGVMRIGLQRDWPIKAYLTVLEPAAEIILLGLHSKITTPRA